MKLLLILLTLAFIASCSSSETKETPAAETAKTDKSHKKSEKKAAKATETKSDSKDLKCKKNDDERTLAIVTKDGLCEVKYMKHGKLEPRGSATKDMATCEGTFNRVKTSLTSAGFTCE